MSGFQSAVNIYNAAGVIGEIAFGGPIRTEMFNLYSAGVPNLMGYAFTKTAGGDPQPSAAAPNAGNATVGGTGVFAGILCNPKQYASYGTSTGGPLAATLALPDYTIGELMGMGYLFVSLPGPASVGDLVTYDQATGALNSIAPLTTFTASIAAGGSSTPDVMTVTAVGAGALTVGQPITGAGVPGGTYILSLGTGKGYTGTYNLSSINTLTVSSEAMTSPNLPVAALSITATFATNVMTVASVVSGQVRVGDQLFGVGIPANTVVTAFGSGVGGTGTYTLNQTVGTITPAIAVTGPTNILVPRAVVEEFTTNSAGGVAVIKLTN